MLAVLDKVAILQKVKLFKGLPFDDIIALSRIARTEAFRSGSILFRQGDSGDCLYIIIDGAITLALEGQKGAAPIQTLGAKDYFGEMAIIDGEPRSATALVAAHSVLLTISKQDFHRMVREMPDMAMELLRLLSHRVRTLQSEEKR